jgi:hypothetical protein
LFLDCFLHPPKYKMPGNQWLSNAYAVAENNGILSMQEPPEQLEDVFEEGADEADPPMEEATEEATEDEFDLEAEPAALRDYVNNARRSLGNVDVNLNLSNKPQSNTTTTSGNSLRSLGGRLLGAVDSVGFTVPTGTDNEDIAQDDSNVAFNVNLHVQREEPSQTIPTNATRGQFLAPFLNNVLPPNVQIGSGGADELPATPPVTVNLNLPSKLGGDGNSNNAQSEDRTRSGSHICGCKRWVFILIVVLVVVVVALVVGIVAATTNKGNGSSSSSRSIEPEGGGNGASTININKSPSTMVVSNPAAPVPIPLPPVPSSPLTTPAPTVTSLTSTPTVSSLTSTPTVTTLAPTAIVTPAPTRDIQAIVTFINSQTLSGQTLVYPSSGGTQTRENLALQLLIEDAPYPYTIATESDKIRIVQAYALLMLQTQDVLWQASAYYLDLGSDECQWVAGTACSSKDLGSSIGIVNVITKIEFQTFNGYLPSDVGLLTHLESFVSPVGMVAGTLPTTIGRWSLLRKFSVTLATGLTGTLPAAIGQWSQLLYFDVSVNFGLTGTIPDSIGNWSVIETINVQQTGLTGSIPEGICDTVTAPPPVDCNIECSCCTTAGTVCF